MLYMVIENFRGGDPVPVYRRFRDRGRLMPDGIEYRGSWVTGDLRRCFQIMECEDRRLLDQWMANWSDITDFDVIPVVTSSEAAAAVKVLDLNRSSSSLAPALILPGLYNSGPEHWQSRWESVHPELRRVMQDDWERPRCADWIARLDTAILATPDSVLVAHSSSCALVAHWAATAGSERRVRGALLVAPSDTEAASYPEGPTGFAPMPLRRLPFPTIVVASTDDPYVTAERARTFAEAWGSRFVSVGDAGHINSQSGLGDWPAGFALLQELRRP